MNHYIINAIGYNINNAIYSCDDSFRGSSSFNLKFIFKGELFDTLNIQFSAGSAKGQLIILLCDRKMRVGLYSLFWTHGKHTSGLLIMPRAMTTLGISDFYATQIN
ncbi:hypothetical protein ACJX0J_034190, partial [Zea mays]